MTYRPGTGASEVMLASINLHGGRDGAGAAFDVAAACRQLKADIIVLQEFWQPDGQPDLLAGLAGELDARAFRADLLAGLSLQALSIAADTGTGRWGLAVLTTLPVAGYQVIGVGRAPGDVTVRAAQLVSVTLPGGGTLRVANTHLTHRLISPVQLVRLLRALRRAGAPTVIAGDLNMPAPVTGIAAGYAPVVRGRTFPAHRPVVQLDHVLAGPGVTGEAGEVLPDLGSDHLPIRARLRLS